MHDRRRDSRGVSVLRARALRLVDSARAHSPLFDHVVRAGLHYEARQGSTLAAAVTYYAFLSFFPVLALGFAAVGAISAYAPEAQRALEQGLQDVLPGMVGEGPGELSLSTLAAAAGPVAGLGGLGVLYSGLSWVSSMRSALQSMFDTPTADRPGLVAGYARDLAALLVIGVVLVLSVVVTGLVTGFSERIAGLIRLEAGLAWMLTGLSVALGLVANALLFVAMFRLLAEPRVGAAAVWSGALLGGAGFELLKQASAWLLASTTRQPAFQAFGIALILLVWISYFSRIVMFAAAWARTWGAVPPGAGGPTPGR